MPFYHFSQNNSGGDFVFEFDRGVTHHVIVEAGNRQAAKVEAIMHGLYFDGCAQGLDCSCCGDRWSGWADESAQPEVYGEPLGVKTKPGIQWMLPNPETVVHFADGTRKWYWADKTEAVVAGDRFLPK